MKPRVMKAPKMQQLGSYRPPKMGLPGQLNTPRRGRPGKMQPTMKRLLPVVRRGR